MTSPIKLGSCLIRTKVPKPEYKMKRKNKRGWIRIIEAFIAVLLITGVLLFVINKGYIGKRDISEQVYQVQLAVLREIQLNSDLRTQILSISLEEEVPEEVTAKINKRIPDYLNCTSSICNLSSVCPMEEVFIERDIYAQSVAIAAEGEEYGPRQLKLFCWTAG